MQKLTWNITFSLISSENDLCKNEVSAEVIQKLYRADRYSDRHI